MSINFGQVKQTEIEIDECEKQKQKIIERENR